DDRARRCVQMMRAPIIAETAPVLERAVDRRFRERAHVGKARNETLVVRNDGRDLSLLQHDLREPDPVRVARALPREVMAAVLALPRNQTRGERSSGRRVALRVRQRIASRWRAFAAASDCGYFLIRSSSVRRDAVLSPSSNWLDAMVRSPSGTF